MAANEYENGNGNSRRQPITISQDFVQREILQLKLDLLAQLPSKERVERIERQIGDQDIRRIATDVETLKNTFLSTDKITDMITEALGKSSARVWSVRTRLIGALAALATIGALLLNIYIVARGK